jgi:hypothetical protein
LLNKDVCWRCCMDEYETNVVDNPSKADKKRLYSTFESYWQKKMLYGCPVAITMQSNEIPDKCICKAEQDEACKKN